MSVYGVTGGVAGSSRAVQMISSYTANMYFLNNGSFMNRESGFDENKKQSEDKVQLEKNQIATSKDSAKKLSEVWKSVNELSENVTSFDKESKDLEELLKKTHRFVKSYNAVLESVKEVSSLSLKREAQKLVEDAKANAGSYAKIGISITNSGALEMDKDKFRKTDAEKVKNVLKETEKCTEQIGKKASSVKEKVKKEILKSNTYNKSGAYSFNFNCAIESYI